MVDAGRLGRGSRLSLAELTNDPTVGVVVVVLPLLEPRVKAGAAVEHQSRRQAQGLEEGNDAHESSSQDTMVPHTPVGVAPAQVVDEDLPGRAENGERQGRQAPGEALQLLLPGPGLVLAVLAVDDEVLDGLNQTDSDSGTDCTCSHGCENAHLFSLSKGIVSCGYSSSRVVVGMVVVVLVVLPSGEGLIPLRGWD